MATRLTKARIAQSQWADARPRWPIERRAIAAVESCNMGRRGKSASALAACNRREILQAGRRRLC